MATRSTSRSTRKAPTTRGKKPSSVKATRATASRSASKTSGKSPKKPRDMGKLLEKLGIWFAIFIVTLVGIDYAVQYLNHKATVAIVNGERIYRKEYLKQLEDTYGYVIANQMISEALIHQQGEEEGVTITDEQIDSEISDAQTRYGGEDAFQELLDAQGITMEELRGEYETSLLLEALMADSIDVTDEEMQDFYEQYKDLYFPEEQYATYEKAKTAVEERLTRQKMEEGLQTWLTELQSEATITNNIEDPKGYSFLGVTRTFFSDLLGL